MWHFGEGVVELLLPKTWKTGYEDEVDDGGMKRKRSEVLFCCTMMEWVS